jgi:hypothetical protein
VELRLAQAANAECQLARHAVPPANANALRKLEQRRCWSTLIRMRFPDHP